MTNHTNKRDYSEIEIPVIKIMYDLYKFTHKLVLKFPKPARYTVGERLLVFILTAIELFIRANISTKFIKEDLLIKANSKIELCKIFFRLAMEIGVIEQREYLNAQKMLQEAGRMTGGWIKYTRSE